MDKEKWFKGPETRWDIAIPEGKEKELTKGCLHAAIIIMNHGAKITTANGRKSYIGIADLIAEKTGAKKMFDLLDRLRNEGLTIKNEERINKLFEELGR